jgi:ATP adenylyltransferase
MLLVPRAEEFFGTISVNALGFAGALLAKNDQEKETLKQRGPMAVLKHTAQV